MKTQKNIYKILLSVFLMIGLNVDAQQESMLTQFAMNMMSINPGYTGYREVQSFSVVHRSQWVGYKGAPITDVFSFDMATNKREMAIGGSIMNDKIGPSNELGMTFNYTYRLKTSLNSTLSLGVQGYGGLYQANLTDLDLVSEYVGGVTDPNFNENPDNVFLLNFGLGAFYHTKNGFIGISSPKIMRNKLGNTSLDDLRSLDGRSEPTLYLNGGHTFEIHSNVDLQPVLMLKGTEGAPISMGGYMNFIFKDAFKVGLVYYHKEVAGMLAEAKLNHRMRVGYSFDVPVTGLIAHSYGSHEISATYEMRVFKERLIYARRF